jgi:hypothetical protein
MNKGLMYWIGHIFAWLLVIGMVVSLPFAIAARDLGAVLFSPDRIQTILRARLVESGTLNRVLAEALFDGENIAGGNDWYRQATAHLSEPERQELLRLLVPQGWLDEQILNISGSFFVWLESDQSAPDLSLNMEPVKAQLLGESLDRAVEIFVDSWPSCSPEEVELLRDAINDGRDIPTIVCEPPEPVRSLIVDQATRALARETTAVPDRVPILGAGTDDLREFQSIKQSLRGFRVSLAWSWLVPLAALGPIMALKIRGKDDLGRWWGMPLFFAGMTSLVLTLILRSSRSSFIDNLLNEAGPPGSVQYELVEVIVQSAANQALRLMLVHALMIAFIGLSSWFILTRLWSGRTAAVPEAKGEISEPLSGQGRETPASPPPLPPLDSEPQDEQVDGPPSGIFG